ncbi:PREDICTED: cytochrome P450 71A9-like [Fragaria vesca subsp. vesca]
MARELSYISVSLVFSPYGEHWREIRKIVMLELLGPKRIQMFRSVRDEEVGVMIDSITRNSKGIINLNEVSLHLANNIVCRCAFGRKFDGAAGDNSKSTINELIEETRMLLGGFFLSDYIPWMGWLDKFSGLEKRADKCFEGLDNISDTVIEEHRDPKMLKPENEDLVAVLLRLQNDPNQAITLTNDQMKAVINDMFIGGTDTTTSTLVWTMAELIRHPVALTKAQNEVRELIKSKGKVEESDLHQLVYLKSVIKEGLRLHPPLPLQIPRQTTESCTIGDYHIPAKTMVFVHAKMIGRDPKVWENPNEFCPERFLDSSVVELTLANLLYRFDWELPDGMKTEDLDMKEAAGLIVHKKVQLCLAATPVYL